MQTIQHPFRILLLFICIYSVHLVTAQPINFDNLKGNNKHLITASGGLEYGIVYSAGYGYFINNKSLPVVITADYSIPSGARIFDDFKIRTGAQVQIIRLNNFILSSRLNGVFRRFENDFVRMADFGCEITGILGYYRTRWFAATEAGFDKAIATNFRHSATFRKLNSYAPDGWYEPGTGGNFYYGIQAGVSSGRHSIGIKAGKVLTQDFKTTPLLPFYAQLGYVLKL